MKRVLIIGSLAVDDKDRVVFETYVDGTRRTLVGQAKVTVSHIERLSIVIGSNDFDIYDEDSGSSLAELDLVVLHGRIRRNELAYVVSRFCAHKKVNYLNDFSAYYTGSKISQAVVFYENKASQPLTIFSLDQEQLLKQAESMLPLPFILKDMHGTQGKSNYLVRTIEEAQVRLDEEPHITFMAQEFCPNECDYRLLLTPEQALTIMRRAGSDTHLNNTSAGATASVANGAVPQTIIAKAREVAAALGLTISGVDVMQNTQTGKFVFIEINSQPQVFSGALLPQKAAFMTEFFGHILTGTSDEPTGS